MLYCHTLWKCIAVSELFMNSVRPVCRSCCRCGCLLYCASLSMWCHACVYSFIRRALYHTMTHVAPHDSYTPSCLYIYIYIYIHTHVDTCVCMCTCVCICKFTCRCMRRATCKCVHTHTTFVVASCSDLCLLPSLSLSPCFISSVYFPSSHPLPLFLLPSCLLLVLLSSAALPLSLASSSCS